jgi:general secretion pathway protein H
VKSHRGFTLVEILLVLGIMGTVVTLGLSRIKRKDNSLKSVARKMLVLTKEVRNRARLTGSTYRIVFQLSDQDPSYWVESAVGRQKRETEEQRKKREDDEKDSSRSGSQDSSKKSAASRHATGFSRDDRFGKKPRTLPSGLYFGSVEIAGVLDPTKSGTEFIYFSPDGFVEASLIQITDKKKITWSMAINPLTGQLDIIQDPKALKDLER